MEEDNILYYELYVGYISMLKMSPKYRRNGKRRFSHYHDQEQNFLWNDDFSQSECVKTCPAFHFQYQVPNQHMSL